MWFGLAAALASLVNAFSLSCSVSQCPENPNAWMRTVLGCCVILLPRCFLAIEFPLGNFSFAGGPNEENPMVRMIVAVVAVLIGSATAQESRSLTVFPSRNKYIGYHTGIFVRGGDQTKKRGDRDFAAPAPGCAPHGRRRGWGCSIRNNNGTETLLKSS
jgi:hypothetical protein